MAMSFAALAGFVVGALAVLFYRNQIEAPSRTAAADGAGNGAALPQGIASVLAVLPSSAVVLDAHDRVLRASSAARAFGLVKGDRLMAAELLALARQVRRDGEIRESEIDVASTTSSARRPRTSPSASHPSAPTARCWCWPRTRPSGAGSRPCAATSSPTSATS